jgi:hypothetical protein
VLWPSLHQVISIIITDDADFLDLDNQEDEDLEPQAPVLSFDTVLRAEEDAEAARLLAEEYRK